MRLIDKLQGAIGAARQRDETVTVFYLDLDGFKPVNDEFGHDAGDQILSMVGERLTSRTRATDVVARLGGDEFVVLIDGHPEADAADALAERLHEAFSSPFTLDGRPVTVGASIGRAVFPTDAQDAEGLLRIADEAMFEAKRAVKARAGLRAVRAC